MLLEQFKARTSHATICDNILLSVSQVTALESILWNISWALYPGKRSFCGTSNHKRSLSQDRNLRNGFIYMALLSLHGGIINGDVQR